MAEGEPPAGGLVDAPQHDAADRDRGRRGLDRDVLYRHQPVAPRDGQPAIDRTVRIRYCDRFEKRGGEWRIAHRKVVYSPSTIDDGYVDWEFGPDQLLESRDRNDPSYWGRC